MGRVAPAHGGRGPNKLAALQRRTPTHPGGSCLAPPPCWGWGATPTAARPSACSWGSWAPRARRPPTAGRVRAALGTGVLLVALPACDDDGTTGAAGFDRHLTKPADPAELLRLLGR